MCVGANDPAGYPGGVSWFIRAWAAWCCLPVWLCLLEKPFNDNTNQEGNLISRIPHKNIIALLGNFHNALDFAEKKATIVPIFYFP